MCRLLHEPALLNSVSFCLYFIGNPVFARLPLAELRLIKWAVPHDKRHIYMLLCVAQPLKFAHFWMSVCKTAFNLQLLQVYSRVLCYTHFTIPVSLNNVNFGNFLCHVFHLLAVSFKSYSCQPLMLCLSLPLYHHVSHFRPSPFTVLQMNVSATGRACGTAWKAGKQWYCTETKRSQTEHG